MISVAMGYIDDVARYGIRALFSPPNAGMKFDSNNPNAFLDALRNKNPEAIAGMKRMHYGAFYSSTGKSLGFNRLAAREIRMKGAGLSGAIFGRPLKGLGVGLGHLSGLGYFAVGAGAIKSFSAPRGHKLSSFSSGMAGTFGFAVGDVLGSMLAGPVGGLALGSLTELAGDKLGEAAQFLHDFKRNITHINMGGNYEDTRVAYTMRQRAAQEMGSSVMNARSWLGKEGLLMHQ